MGRRKIEIKPIKDDRNRSVTFLKRKGGLFKKAHELSVLCNVEVAVIIFNQNKKIHQFCSGNIQELILRHHHGGPAHEHKGPDDFKNKDLKEGDDDDDDTEHTSPPPAQNAGGVGMQHHPSFQHIQQGGQRASPQMSNGNGHIGANGQIGAYDHRHASPQPGTMSRPDSRAQMRRQSSNMASHPMAQAPMVQDRFDYDRQRTAPPSYGMGMGMPLPVSQPMHSSNYHPMVPSAQMLAQPSPPQLPHMSQSVPQLSYSHAPQTEPQMSYASYQPQRARSIPPPSFPQPERPPPQSLPPVQNSMSMPMASPPLPQPQQQQHQVRPQYQNGQHLAQPRPLHVEKKNSIFTPIETKNSMFQDFLNSSSESHQQQQQSQTRTESARSHPVETAPMTQSKGEGLAPPPPVSVSQYERTQPETSMTILAPPPRTNSLQADKKPLLKLQIPSEHSDTGSATADSSPKDSGTTGATPARTSNASSKQLPPPSPSANSILSAGATGPPNPFARPPPPQSAYGSRTDNMDTPASALPSQFVNHLLPSPSNNYSFWDQTNLLPSPLTYGMTPVTQTGNGFGDSANGKRKSDGEENGARGDKKPKI